MVPIAAPARRSSLRRAAAPTEAARAPAVSPLRRAVLLALLLPACSIGLPEGDPLAEPALPIEPLTIVDPGVIYTDADDEDLDVPGLQVTLRIEVGDEAIERVRLRNDADLTELSKPVRDDLDGRRMALFLISLPRDENPVTASAPELRIETRGMLRALGANAPGR